MIRVVGAVLINHDHVVLARRASSLKNFPGLFEFPGGKIEASESPEQALARELREELNINVELKAIEGFDGNIHQSTLEKSGKVIHLTLFIVRTWEGTLTLDDRIHSELAHVPIKELDRVVDLIPGDATFVPSIQDTVGASTAD